jgi:hypothetical protein
MSAAKLRGPIAAYVHGFNNSLAADEIRYKAFVVDFSASGEPIVTDIDIQRFPLTHGNSVCICSLILTYASYTLGV